MSSATFRKTYASLTDHTDVTVNGHVIGRWSPINAPHRVVYAPMPARLASDEDVVDLWLGTPDQQAIAADRLEHGKPGVTLIEQRPFTPVPKPKRR